MQETPPQESVPAGTPKVELSEATGVPEQAQSPSTAGKSPQGVQLVDPSPVDAGDVGELPRKRASRASKNAAMASWKANRMLEEDGEDEGSLEEDRPGRRSKKVCPRRTWHNLRELLFRSEAVVCVRQTWNKWPLRSCKVLRCHMWPVMSYLNAWGVCLQPKREDSANVPVSAKAGPALAKVYSNATAAISNVLGEDHGTATKDPAGLLNCFNNGQQWSSGGGPSAPLGVGDLGLPTGSQQNMPLANIPRSSTLPGSQGDVGGGAGGWGGPGGGSASGGPGGMSQMGGSGAADAPVRPQSTPLNPFTNYHAFHHEQDLWRRRVGEINNQWVQKLQEGAKTNAEVQALLRYYMSLPDVSQVYPVNADARMGGPMASTGSGGAPSPGLGGNNGHGSANLPTGSGIQVRCTHWPPHVVTTHRMLFCAQCCFSGLAEDLLMWLWAVAELQCGCVQGSGQLNGASPMGMQQGANSQRRTLTGQGLGPWNATPARKESLHNGPISAQDLATGIRGRPASSEDSRQCASFLARLSFSPAGFC